MKLKSFSLAVLAAMVFAAPSPGRAAEKTPYRLGPGDVLQIGVFGVADFARRVTVNVDGDLSTPFLGEVHAEGLTINDLRTALTDGLKKDGRIQMPDVTVEMIEHRPFYISGDVSRPGAVPYRPGLTVRHAIALAGGYDALRFRTENPLMTAPDLKSENEGLWIDYARAQAHVASLKSEIAGKDDIDLGALSSLPLSRKSIDNIGLFEKNDLKMREENYGKQRDFLQASLKSATSNVAALEDTFARNKESLSLQQDAVDRMSQTASKGLVTTNRVDDERRSLAEIRAQQADAEARLMQARRDRDEVTRNIAVQDEQHRMQLNDALRDATIDTEKLASRLKASGEKLLYTGAVKAQIQGGKSSPDMMIYRKVDGETMTIAASEDTEVLPDDMLEISIKPEQMMPQLNSQ